MEYKNEILNLFSKEWALLCAGDKDSYNAMTIGWGNLGTMWGRPCCTVYVYESRYTYDFIEKSDYFTVSIYDEKYREALKIMGEKSGRDCDKVSLAGLTPDVLEHGVTFKEAKTTFVCKKIYQQRMDVNEVPEQWREKMYSNGMIHHLYIGEIVDVIGEN